MNKTKKSIDRREFLDKGVKIAAAASVFGFTGDTGKVHAATSERMKIVLVGTGQRGTSMWGKDLIHPYRDYVEMVGMCDINPKRLEVAKRLIDTDARCYVAKDFDRMIKETKPDSVIVTTPDCFHEKYAIRAMELGCNTIVEKPLVTDENQCQRLIETEIKTGKNVTTTFNARHGASAVKIKEIVLSGELGRIISTEFQEYLDVYHGARYFRRWHGKSRFSGTLLVHKASHHFDQMNWWLDAEPEEVHAFGKLDFYGSNNPFRHTKCRGCPFTEKCDFYFDITKDQRLMDLYVSCEDADGYFRDRCVWDNENDTYDSMTVEVKYNNGVLLSYTLNAYLPYEGQLIAFNGEKGRLDVRRYIRQPWEATRGSQFRLTKSFKDSKQWTVTRGKSKQESVTYIKDGHGGSDVTLKDLIFKPNQPDPLGKLAGSRAGIMSSLVGIAARKSIETGETIKIADLINFPLIWKW